MSGWTALTLVPRDGKKEELVEALRERLDTHDRVADRGDRVEVHVGGYDAQVSGSDWAGDHLEATAHLWDRCARIDANDTTDSGVGYVYESDGDTYSKADVGPYHGADGARAHDVRQSLEAHVSVPVAVR